MTAVVSLSLLFGIIFFFSSCTLVSGFVLDAMSGYGGLYTQAGTGTGVKGIEFESSTAGRSLVDGALDEV